MHKLLNIGLILLFGVFINIEALQLSLQMIQEGIVYTTVKSLSFSRNKQVLVLATLNNIIVLKSGNQGRYQFFQNLTDSSTGVHYVKTSDSGLQIIAISQDPHIYLYSYNSASQLYELIQQIPNGGQYSTLQITDNFSYLIVSNTSDTVNFYGRSNPNFVLINTIQDASFSYIQKIFKTNDQGLLVSFGFNLVSCGASVCLNYFSNIDAQINGVYTRLITIPYQVVWAYQNTDGNIQVLTADFSLYTFTSAGSLLQSTVLRTTFRNSVYDYFDPPILRLNRFLFVSYLSTNQQRIFQILDITSNFSSLLTIESEDRPINYAFTVSADSGLIAIFDSHQRIYKLSEIRPNSFNYSEQIERPVFKILPGNQYLGITVSIFIFIIVLLFVLACFKYYSSAKNSQKIAFTDRKILQARKHKIINPTETYFDHLSTNIKRKQKNLDDQQQISTVTRFNTKSASKKQNLTKNNQTVIKEQKQQEQHNEINSFRISPEKIEQQGFYNYKPSRFQIQEVQ